MIERVISLDGLTMNAVATDENGVIGVDTIFKFRQAGECVSAEYAGGRIRQGYLVGLNSHTKLVFRFCQLESDGAIKGGESTAILKLGNTGLVRLIENFESASRPGGGKNIIQELRADEH